MSNPFTWLDLNDEIEYRTEVKQEWQEIVNTYGNEEENEACLADADKRLRLTTDYSNN